MSDQAQPEWDLPGAAPAVVGKLSKNELHSEDIKIDQRDPVHDADDRDGVILVDKALADKEYLDALAFMEEPVTIRIEPSADKNEAPLVEIWCNGQGAQVFMNGQWHPMTWLPVGEPIIIKRKILEILARTKRDTVQTVHEGGEVPMPRNTVRRFTTAVRSFSVLEDRNPRGAAWLTEIRRRNF